MQRQNRMKMHSRNPADGTRRPDFIAFRRIRSTVLPAAGCKIRLFEHIRRGETIRPQAMPRHAMRADLRDSCSVWHR